MLKISLQAIFILMVLLSTTGCSQFGNLNFGRIFKSALGQSETSHIADIKTEADNLLSQDKAAEALIVIWSGLDNGIPEEKLAISYIRAINSLIAIADRMYMEQNFTKAGNSYRLALKNYPTHPSLTQQVIRNQNDIDQQIKSCADQLLDEGLIAYRNGELQTAIDIWSQIRQFHPSYKASQQAISTTRTQLRNLESIENGPG